MIGRTLNGAHRVHELMGSGGFADVYLGRDVRSNTVVAIKVLHPHFARDPQLVRRFLQEARTAQTLQEPHIVRVLDAGEDAGTYYIVMEYVQGHTLAHILKERGALPVPDALEYARQILLALDAAHKAGIVHRDIKPQNIMVTPEGTVKVMDFGIAKHAAAGTMTQTGMHLGTPQYMSPEQARGEKVDARSDLYSLAIVLYEMLGGGPPFDAESPWQVLRMQTDQEPLLLSSLRSDIPAWLVQAVAKGLEKSPGERFQTARDMLGDLAPQGTDQQGGLAMAGKRATPAHDSLPSRRTPSRASRRPGWLWPALVLAALAALAAFWYVDPPTPPPALPTTLCAPGRIVFSSDRDGTGQEIYVMNADGNGQTRLTKNYKFDSNPSWSPDGRHIAFGSDQDGSRAIYVMNADGSGQTRLTSDRSESLFPSWSPDGQHVAFSATRYANRDIYMMNVDGSEQVNITYSPGEDLFPSWSPDGQHIAFSSNRLGDGEIFMMNTDGSEQTRLTDSPGEDVFPSWSPDGRHIAFHSSRDGDREIYVMNADGSRQTRLTNSPGGNLYPAWSPDGRQIAFTSYRNGNAEIYLMNPDGSGQTRVTDNPGDDSFPSWTCN